MVAPQKRGAVKVNRGRRSDGGIQTFILARALNKAYEDDDFTAGESPVVHNFNTDMGYNSIMGWITCDGPGEIQVEFTRDGTTYGDPWRMFPGENTDLRGFDIHALRVTHLGTDTAYRIFLI
jgi:hypothetical protein